MTFRTPSVRVVVVGLVVALALVATSAFVHGCGGSSVAWSAAARRTVTQRLVVSGRVLAPTRIALSSEATGVVARVLVDEGARVAADDLLAELDPADARASEAQARAAVAQARARLEQVRGVGALVASEVRAQAEATFDHADAERLRAERLFATGAISSAERDNARRAADVARSQRDAAEAQYRGARGADARVAEAALAQAEAELAAAEVRLARTQLRAPRPGVVLERDVEPGDLAQPGRTLFALAADDAPEVLVFPDERDLALLHVGQPARVSADAFPADAFDAVVRRVAPSIDAQRGTVELRLQVVDPPPYLLPDMTVSVDLEVARVEGAIVVPSGAVHEAASRTPWVLVVAGGRAARRDVAVGARGDDVTQLTSGVGEGEVVLVPGAQPIAPGDRVRLGARVASDVEAR